MKKKVHQFLALACALVMLFGLVACGPKDPAAESPAPGPEQTQSQTPVTPPDPTVKYKETIKISSASELQGAGYYSYTNQFMTNIGRMTMEGLTRFNWETNEVENVLAKEVTDVNGDGKTWRVVLQEGVMFHYQGKEYAELKASDVKWTYFDFLKKDGLGTTSGVQARTLTAPNYMESVDVVNDYELVFHLSTNLFDFPEYMADAPVLCQAAMEEFGYSDGQEAFTGPYYLNREKSVQGQQWVVTRYEDYWGGAENYPTKEFIFVIHTDENTGAAALAAGEVDVLINSSPTIALQFQNNPGYIVHSTPSTTINFLGFNSYDGTGFFDNEDDPDQVKLRQAIGLAIDRDEMVSVLYATNPSAGSRVDSHFAASTNGYVELGKFEYNVDKAKGMMEELGYNDNNRLKLSLVFYAENSTFAQLVQSQLKKIYIDVELNTIDRKQFGTTLRTGQNWDMAVNYYATSNLLGSTMNTCMHTTGGTGKTWGWSSAAADEKIENVMAQTTLEAQKAAFAEFQEWIRDYVPRIPIHTGAVMLMAKEEVEGIFVCPDVSRQNFTSLRIPE